MLFWSSRSVSCEDIIFQGICAAVYFSGRIGIRMRRRKVLKEKNRHEQTEWGFQMKTNRRFLIVQ